LAGPFSGRVASQNFWGCLFLNSEFEPAGGGFDGWVPNHLFMSIILYVLGPSLRHIRETMATPERIGEEQIPLPAKRFPMKKKKRLIIASVGAAVLLGGGFLLLSGSKTSSENALPAVKATRGNIVDKALAVGTVEPENEISIKSKVSGVVKRIFADAGSFVKAGDRLLEVKPDPTPLELADAKRQVQLKEVDMENLTKESIRQESMARKQLISAKEYEDFQRTFQEAQLQLKIAREHLALLESGKVTIENTEIESIIKAPIDGYVLRKMVEVGDPVTPLTSYQEGTVLMKMANMERLVFKGTVDEIDVGKLKEGMPAELKVGALPNEKIEGQLSKISLKAEKKENATVFPIEVSIPSNSNAVLRAGYSANVNVIIQKKDSVLTIPERTVTFRNDSAFVKVVLGPGKDEERWIKTGLSDAINIEVLSGLSEGDSVREKPIKKIE
jgi:HlyD family secretion protein